MMHLKRYSIPKFWKSGRKEGKFTVKPVPGPHTQGKCIPAAVLLRNVLGIAENAREAGDVLKNGGLLVDKKAVKEARFPVGFMDVVEIPASKKCYRVSVDTRGLVLEDAQAKDSGRKLCRIQSKKTVKGGKFQLNLHDGRNILTDKKSFRPNDSVLIELPSQKILKHFQFEKNQPAMVMYGRNMGVRGKIKSVYDRKTLTETNRVVLDTGKGEMETVKDYVLVGEIK